MIADIFRDWRSFDFPEARYVIYVVGIEIKGKFEPFYVGESSRSQYGRIGDYVSGQKSASADFKVGKAIEYLRSKGLPIKIRFKPADQEDARRKTEEKDWTNLVARNYARKLLNDLQPRTNAEMVQVWVKEFLEKLGVNV